jgi:ribosomal protein S27E
MKKNLKCPKCDSSQTRYRVKTKDHICYVCGNIYNIEEENK